MKLNLTSVFGLRMGLKWKFLLGLGALLLIALLVMGGTMYYQAMNLAVDELLQTTDKNIEKDVQRIEGFVKNTRDDLMALTEMPPVKGIIRAQGHAGVDPLTGNNVAFWYARLEEIFSATIKYHPEYYQIRYLDQQGNELVRVDLIGNKVQITPKKALQNKSEYPYFTETMKLSKDKVYYSPVNLNREHGAIQLPHTPVFRLATPVHDQQNKAIGIIVINTFAEALFSNIRIPNDEILKYVINQDGYLLVHPDRAWEFEFDLEPVQGKRIIRNSMQELLEEIQGGDSRVNYDKYKGHVDGFRKIYYDARNRNNWWAVVHEIPESKAFKNIHGAGNTMVIAGILIIICSLLVITWILSKRIITPVLRLSEAVSNFEHGDFSARVPEEGRNDELGELAISVNRMADTTERNINELTVLNRVTLAASSSLNIHVMVNRVFDAILEQPLFKFQSKAALFIANQEARALSLEVARGFSEEQKTSDATVSFGECFCGKAVETGEAIYTAGCLEDPLYTRKCSGKPPYGHAVLPLKIGEKVLGVLVLYLANDSPVSSGDARLCQSISDILAVALQNALHYAHIDRLKSQRGLILNSLGEGVYGSGIDGNCTFVNPTAERMLGYEAGELLGRNLHATLHHTRREGTAYPNEQCPIFASFQDNAVHHVTDEVFWKKDGTSFPVEYTSTPIRDKSGTAVGAVVVFSDISERMEMEKELKESNERYLALYDGIDDALFVHGMTADGSIGNFIEVNNKACRRLGYSRNELLKMSPFEIDAPESDTDMSSIVEKIYAGNSVTFIQTHVTKTGRRIPVEIRSHIFMLQGQKAVISLARDITERKQAERIIQMNNRLLSSISLAQSMFITAVDPHELFNGLLSNLLSLTGSEYGFIGEIYQDPDGAPYLKTRALTNIAWNEETRNIFKATAKKGFEFRNLKSLYGTVLSTGSMLISNSPSTDPRRGGIPDGHPPINALMCLPIYSGEKMIGMAGLANRPGGYDEILAAYLQPFIVTCGNIMVAHSNTVLRKQAEDKIKEYSETLEIKVDERTKELNAINIELKKLVNAIEQSDESIVITDLHAIIQYVNPAFSLRTGYSIEETIGQNPSILQSGLTPRAVYDDLWATIRSGRPWRGTFINKKKSGELYHEDATIAPVFDEQGDVLGYVAAKTDVTDRIRIQEHLRQKNAELEQARQIAEAASTAKSDFLANMSHELRTPLNAIIGFSEIMGDGLCGPVTGEQKEYLGNILSSGSHLLHLINDILDLSKVEAGKMELELDEMNLQEVLENSLVMVKEKAMKHRIALEKEIAPDIGIIIADERKIKQVVFNLLSNAVKFTLEGGAVRVSARRVKGPVASSQEARTPDHGPRTLDADFVEISVSDTGIGIKTEDLEKLFMPFKQIESTLTKSRQGTGLGLNLSKKLVELHGGRIRVESEFGKGSRFILEIPVKHEGSGENA